MHQTLYLGKWKIYFAFTKLLSNVKFHLNANVINRHGIVKRVKTLIFGAKALRVPAMTTIGKPIAQPAIANAQRPQSLGRPPKAAPSPQNSPQWIRNWLGLPHFLLAHPKRSAWLGKVARPLIPPSQPQAKWWGWGPTTTWITSQPRWWRCQAPAIEMGGCGWREESKASAQR